MNDAAASGAGGRRFELAILSRPGGRPVNEDACGHWHGEGCLCCVVADGAGGHGGGDVASKLVVRHLIEQAAAAPPTRPEEVRDLIVGANARLRHERARSPATADMYSTVVALFVDLASQQAVWGHAGDSRLYLFRGRRMVGHTHDHSVVQSMVESGAMSALQAQRHERRSELRSALGSDPQQLLVSTGARPWPVDPGDAFLLCTDGLWEYVDDAQMDATLDGVSNPTDWLAQLERLVVRHAAEAGDVGHDNFSGIAVWVGAD